MNMADKSATSKRHGKKRNMQRKREIPDDLFRTRTSKDLESEVNLKDVLCNDIPVKPPRRSMILRAFKQNVVSSTPKPVRGARGFSWDISTIDNTASSSSKPISISSTTDCQCENQADEETKTSRQHNNKENSNKTGLNTPKNQQSPPKPAPRTTYTREKQNGLQVPSADKLCIAKGQQRSSSRDGISKLTSPHRSPRQSPQVLAPDKSCEDEDQRRSMAKEGISKTFHDSPKSSQRHALQMLTPTKNCVDKDQKRPTAEGVISKTSFNDSPRYSRKRTNARAEHSVQTSECREDDFQEIIAEAPMMPNVSISKRKMDLAEQAVQTSLADDTGDKITRPDSSKHLVQKSSSGTSLRQSAVPDSEVVEEIPANTSPSRRSSRVKRKESYLHLLYEPVTDADIALSDICYEDLDVGKAKPWRFSVSPKEVLVPMRDLTSISDAVDESEVEDSVQKDACIDLRENEDVFIKPKSMRARRTFANFRNSHLTCSNLTGNTASYLSDRPDEAYRRPSTLSREGSKQEPEKTEKIREQKEGLTPTPEKPDEVRKQKEGSTPTPEKPDEVRKQKGKESNLGSRAIKLLEVIVSRAEEIEQRHAVRKASTTADRKTDCRKGAIDRTVWSEEINECDAFPVRLNESVQQDQSDVSEFPKKRRQRVDDSVANGPEEGSKQEPEKTEKIRKRKEGSTPTPEKLDEVRKQKEGSTPTPEKPDEVRKQKGKSKSTDIPNKRTTHMSPGTSSCQGTGENSILKELASLRAKSTLDPEGLSKVRQKEISLTASRRSARSSKPISRPNVGVLLLTSGRQMTYYCPAVDQVAGKIKEDRKLSKKSVSKRSKRTKKSVAQSMETSQVIDTTNSRKRSKKTKKSVAQSMETSQVIDTTDCRKRSKRTKKSVAQSMETSQVIDTTDCRKRSKRTKNSVAQSKETSQVIDSTNGRNNKKSAKTAKRKQSLEGGERESIPDCSSPAKKVKEAYEQLPSYFTELPDILMEEEGSQTLVSPEGSKQEPEKTEKIRKRKEGSTPTPEKPDEVRKQKGKGKSTDITNKRTAHMSPGTSSCQGTGENRILKELASLRAKSTRDPEEPKERELMNESGYSCGCAPIGSPDMIRATYGRTGLCGEPISHNDILQMCPRVASIALPGLDAERVKLQLQQCEPKISDEVHLINNSEMKDIKVVHRLESTTTFTELQRNISRSKCLGIVDGVTTSDIKIPPGATKPLAKIDNRLLIYIVLEGYGRAQIHSSIACIQPTDRIIIPCGVPYSITNGSKEKDLILNCLKIESHDIMSCT